MCCDSGGVTGGNCKDKDNGCPGWANDGYCTTEDNVEWMAKNCAKSCNKCGGK